MITPARCGHLLRPTAGDGHRHGAAEPNRPHGLGQQDPAWHDNERFFHRGTSGQWRDLLDDDDLERYRARAKAIGPAAVVDWMHRGSL